MKTIPLSNGGEALVDDSDYEHLKLYRWSNTNGYVQGWINKKHVLMHRVIMDAPSGMEVDHINRVRNDNRRSNLRVVTLAENRPCPVRRIGKGYQWHAKNQKWQVQFMYNRRMHYVGLYESEDAARCAYELASALLKLYPYNPARA